MRKSVIVVLPLALLNGVIADGFFYSAYAQCGASDKIYIEPSLVPRQPHISRGAMMAIMLDPKFDSNARMRMCMLYQQQGQPIVVPYGTGKVLVHPTNPCIQQYIP